MKSFTLIIASLVISVIEVSSVSVQELDGNYFFDLEEAESGQTEAESASLRESITNALATNGYLFVKIPGAPLAEHEKNLHSFFSRSLEEKEEITKESDFFSYKNSDRGPISLDLPKLKGETIRTKFKLENPFELLEPETTDGSSLMESRNLAMAVANNLRIILGVLTGSFASQTCLVKQYNYWPADGVLLTPDHVDDFSKLTGVIQDRRGGIEIQRPVDSDYHFVPSKYAFDNNYHLVLAGQDLYEATNRRVVVGSHGYRHAHTNKMIFGTRHRVRTIWPSGPQGPSRLSLIVFYSSKNDDGTS